MFEIHVLCLVLQGIEMQPERANEFQSAILEGEFDEAISLLPNLIQSHHALTQVAHPFLHSYLIVLKSNDSRQGEFCLQCMNIS